MTKPLDLGRYRGIVVLTGAGISAGSGLPTFRGPGGLWERPDGPGAKGFDAAALHEDPAGVWAFCNELRDAVRAAKPNAAHIALAEAESARAPGSSFTIITQNVDSLHQRAGSQNVLELHGSLARTRCSLPACGAVPFDDPAPSAELPRCEACGSNLRADIVLFDEEIPARAEHLAKRALRECDLFVAIGTSGTVWPAANFVRAAEHARARTVLVNLTPMVPRHPAYDEEVVGPAEQLVPILFGPSVA